MEPKKILDIKDKPPLDFTCIRYNGVTLWCGEDYGDVVYWECQHSKYHHDITFNDTFDFWKAHKGKLFWVGKNMTIQIRIDSDHPCQLEYLICDMSGRPISKWKKCMNCGSEINNQIQRSKS